MLYVAVRHCLRNDSLVVCCARRQRLWIEQECLSSAWTSPITPGCRNPVTRRNSDGKVADVLEGRIFTRYYDTGEDRVVRMDMRASLDGCDHRNADVRNVL